jgi:hypothetical protein
MTKVVSISTAKPLSALDRAVAKAAASGIKLDANAPKAEQRKAAQAAAAAKPATVVPAKADRKAAQAEQRKAAIAAANAKQDEPKAAKLGTATPEQRAANIAEAKAASAKPAPKGKAAQAAAARRVADDKAAQQQRQLAALAKLQAENIPAKLAKVSSGAALVSPKGKAAAPKGPRQHAATREMMERAAQGKMPAAPDFSAPTHKSWRKRLDAIVAAAKAGNIKALRADATEPKSSSRVILCRYRDAAIAALEAKAKAAKAK